MRGVAALLLCLVLPAVARTAELPVFRQVAGEIRRVTVERGDTLRALAGRLSVPWETLARANRLEDPDRIYPGQVLEVDTRSVVPALVDEGLVVNVPEAALYRFEAADLAARHAVALGRPGHPTPTGSFAVLARAHGPDRTYASSLEERVRSERQVFGSRAVPGSASGSGEYWIQLSLWGYGIQATRNPAVLGEFLTYGSVWVGRWDMLTLYPKVAQGTQVEVTYLPVKVAVTPGGEVWVEAHPDVYGLGAPSARRVMGRLREEGVAARVAEADVAEVLRERSGVARRVGVAPADAADAGEVTSAARWRCLDCPLGTNRRVTFQIEAREPIDLPNPFPIEIRDDAGRVVFRPQMVAQVLVHLEPGETRNFVWEVRDAEGQPLPPGSYTAVIRFFAGGEKRTLSLPLWVGK